MSKEESGGWGDGDARTANRAVQQCYALLRAVIFFSFGRVQWAQPASRMNAPGTGYEPLHGGTVPL